MPSARNSTEKVGDIWERGRALLAWKLNSKVMVVDIVVVLSGVGGGSIGVYRRKKRRGRNSKYNANNMQHRCMAWQCNDDGVLTQC